MENAKIMKNKLKTAGYKVYGGDNAPYIWIKVPDQMTSWDFFDFLLCGWEHWIDLDYRASFQYLTKIKCH